VNKPPDLLSPLTEAELDELDHFLLNSTSSNEAMTLDMLDGYLSAIAIGPTTISFKQCFPSIWGPNEDDGPEFTSPTQAQHIVDLIIRHFNSIISVLGQNPDDFDPVLDVFVTEDGTSSKNAAAQQKFCINAWTNR